MVNNPPASVARDVSLIPFAARDVSLIPGSGRSPAGGNGNQLQDSCVENPMDRGTWWAIVHRVRNSRAQMKWLSTHKLCILKVLNVISFDIGIHSWFCHLNQENKHFCQPQSVCPLVIHFPLHPLSQATSDWFFVTIDYTPFSRLLQQWTHTQCVLFPPRFPSLKISLSNLHESLPIWLR